MTLSLSEANFLERIKTLDPENRKLKRDEELELKINEIWEDSFRNYGIHKIWHQLLNNKEAVARCAVERRKALGKILTKLN
ncbi:IS3 family transposase [Hirschia baltica]|uniref:IS3 family transposase n=1 Tax=Hirschia baltica TaxID=2724 RepID=UPI0011EA6341